MPRYFMRDTPLQALEQLMMSQPGQKPRGGGIYRSLFHYTPKDVACEYCQNYDRMTGFSPRNVRRMRDFWQMYSDMPELLDEALLLNWTQNVVIMEAELTMEERRWYIQQAAAKDLSKSELL